MSIEFDNLHAPLQPLRIKGIEGDVYIQRDDLIHPLVSGNKWRKLQYHILYARQQCKTRLVTFGGAYSNHLLATAAAGAILGLQTTAFLRADEPIDNHYLRAARLFGMELIPVSREDYRDKQGLYDAHFGHHAHAMFIAEGGAGDGKVCGSAVVKGYFHRFLEETGAAFCAIAGFYLACFAWHNRGFGVGRGGATAARLSGSNYHRCFAIVGEGEYYFCRRTQFNRTKIVGGFVPFDGVILFDSGHQNGRSCQSSKSERKDFFHGYVDC